MKFYTPLLLRKIRGTGRDGRTDKQGATLDAAP